MDPRSWLVIIIVISVSGYIFEVILEYLNLKSQRNDIPDSIAGFYDREKYNKSLAYHRDRTQFSFLTGALAVLASTAMLLFGGFGWLDSILRQYLQSEILLALSFFAIIALTSDILTLPFQLYSTFVIEEKYGFNKTTTKTFFADKLKGYLLGAILGGGLLTLLIFLIKQFGPEFWIWFGLAASAFMLFMNMFATTLILPLFNKLTVLPDGELKTAIQQFAGKVAFPLDNIFVIDGSKRSSKANAFFSGIGSRKKIVLYDTLINNHPVDELVAVLAHEVGHFKKKHIILSYILSVVQIFFVLFVLSLMIHNTNLSMALGGTQSAIHLNLIAFAILFSPVSGVIGLLMSLLSRKNEYEADDYAKENFNGESLGSALKRLSVDTLSNLYPHPAYVFFYYSHPPLLKRLENLNAIRK